MGKKCCGEPEGIVKMNEDLNKEAGLDLSKEMGENFEDEPERVKYHEKREIRQTELKNVLYYLINEAGLKVHQGVQYDRTVEYFRGV